MPFAGYADFDDCVAQNQDKDSPEGFCAWLHYEILGDWPGVASSKDVGIMKKELELIAPIVWKNEDERIVYGPVLVPNVADADGDLVSMAKVEQVAHNFLEKYGTIDIQHGLAHGGVPIESYIAPQDLLFTNHRIPKGSWIMGVRVDEEYWGRVKNGELVGFSLMAVPPGTTKSATPKRTTLADLGANWEVVAVSLVDDPAVPQARWIAIKQNDSATVLAKVKQALNLSTKSGREISDTNFKALSAAHESIGKILERARTERSKKVGKTEETTMDRDKEKKEKTEKEGEGEITPGGTPGEQENPTPKEGGLEDPTPKETEGTLTAEQVTKMIDTAVSKLEQKLVKAFEDALKDASKSRKTTKSLAERLTGQDGHDSDKPITPSRDMFGRKKREQK